MVDLPVDPSELTSLTEGLPGMHAAAQVRRGVQLWQALSRPEVGLTPHTIVHRQNKMVVRYYKPAADRAVGTPVVIVPSMINKAWICDLEQDRSLVAGLAALGHPTFLVDWGEPGPEDADTTIGKVVLDVLRRAVDRCCRHVGADQAFVLGYCQGGVFSTMFAALRPKRVNGLVMLATPVKMREAGRFADFCRAEVCDPDALIGEDGLVDSKTMAPAFKLLDPMGNWHKFIALEAASHDPVRLRRALARERWLEENVAVPGALAKEFIVHGYQNDELLGGTWQLRGETVRLGDITCPVLVTPCRRDFIAPPASCLPVVDALTGSDDVTLDMQPTGHIGVVVGSHGPRAYYPLLDRWFRRVAGEEVP
jgi:polyhydroxyalkanoate synthase